MAIVRYGSNRNEIHFVVLEMPPEYPMQASRYNTCPHKRTIEHSDMDKPTTCTRTRRRRGRRKVAEGPTKRSYIVSGRAITTPDVSYVGMVGTYKSWPHDRR